MSKEKVAMPPLKRPHEIKWRFRQPDGEVFPAMPASGLFLGPSGLGKTTTLVALMTGPYKQVFARLHIFSPSALVDSGWQPIKDIEKRFEEVTWHETFDEAALEAILKEQRDRVSELKAAKTTKPLPQSLIILDDLADTAAVHRTHGLMATLFIRSRHLGVSCWASTQKLTNLAPVARSNARFLFVWRLRGKKELDALMEELSAMFRGGAKDVWELYEAATSQDHSFLTIDYQKRDPSTMFTRSFEERLVLEEDED